MHEEIKIGYCPGVWDMFHPGHLNMIMKARRCCDYLTIGVCGDELVAKHKGHYPIVNEDDRLRIIDALSVVDYPIVYKDEDYIKHIKMTNANVFIVSTDFGKQGVDNHLVALEWCNHVGLEVIKIPRPDGYYSTTELIKMIESGL